MPEKDGLHAGANKRTLRLKESASIMLVCLLRSLKRMILVNQLRLRLCSNNPATACREARVWHF